MGHVNHEDLRKMVRDGRVTGVELDMNSKPDFLRYVYQSQGATKPFPKQSSKDKITAYGSKVSSDVWGPAQVQSLGGSNYSNAYIDHHSHEERVYFMKYKSETFDRYKKYEAWARVQRNAVIKSSGATEEVSSRARSSTITLREPVPLRHLTVHDSPQSNGSAERGNRTKMDLARAMLDDSGLPKNLWAEAVRHGVWVRNRVPSRALPDGKTPTRDGNWR